MTRFLLVVAILILFVVMPARSAFGEVTLIAQCGTVLSEPGNYKLAHDLTSCPGDPDISDNVFVGGVSVLFTSSIHLDLNGHEISCDTSTGFATGILVILSSDVSIRNGSVTGCNDGIGLYFVNDSKVTDMTISGQASIAPLFSGDAVFMQGGINNTIARNHLTGNENRGITMGEGSGNNISKNRANDNGISGIGIFFENNSKFTCNRTNNNVLGGLTLGGAATGNLIKGNQAIGNGFAGIPLFGRSDLPPGVVPIPEGNTVRNNVALSNGLNDVSENQFDELTFDVFVEDGAPCRNDWNNNQFVTELGPAMCIGTPVELEDNDVCALDDDNDD